MEQGSDTLYQGLRKQISVLDSIILLYQLSEQETLFKTSVWLINVLKSKTALQSLHLLN